MVHITVSDSGGRVMSGGSGRKRPRHVGRWRPNAAAPCRAVASERGRVMSGSGGRMRPRHVGQAVAAAGSRVMLGGGGRGRPRHAGQWRPRAAATSRVALMGHGTLCAIRPLFVEC